MQCPPSCGRTESTLRFGASTTPFSELKTVRRISRRSSLNWMPSEPRCGSGKQKRALRPRRACERVTLTITAVPGGEQSSAVNVFNLLRINVADSIRTQDPPAFIPDHVHWNRVDYVL